MTHLLKEIRSLVDKEIKEENLKKNDVEKLLSNTVYGKQKQIVATLERLGPNEKQELSEFIVALDVALVLVLRKIDAHFVVQDSKSQQNIPG